MLTPEEQANFLTELPDIFLPIPGGWGRNGATHVRLDKVTEDVLEGALRVAWKLRVDKNAATQKRKTAKVRSKHPDSRKS